MGCDTFVQPDFNAYMNCLEKHNPRFDVMIKPGEPQIEVGDGTAYGFLYASWHQAINWELWMMTSRFFYWFLAVLSMILLDRFIQVFLLLKQGKSGSAQLVIYFVQLLHLCTLWVHNFSYTHNYDRFAGGYGGSYTYSRVESDTFGSRTETVAYFTCILVLYFKQRMINTMPGAPEGIMSTATIQIFLYFLFPQEELLVPSWGDPAPGVLSTRGYVSRDKMFDLNYASPFTNLPFTPFIQVPRSCDMGTWYVVPNKFLFLWWYRTMFGTLLGQSSMVIFFSLPIIKALKASKTSANSAAKARKLLQIAALNLCAVGFSTILGIWSQYTKFFYDNNSSAWWEQTIKEDMWCVVEGVSTWIIFLDKPNSVICMILTCAPCRKSSSSSSSSGAGGGGGRARRGSSGGRGEAG